MKILSIKIGRYFLLLTLLCIKFNVDAQNLPDIKDELSVKNALGNKYFYTVQFKSYKNKDLQNVKQELEVQLKSSLAKNLISKIKIENTSNLTQLSFNDEKKNTSSLVMKYDFITNIESKLTFSQPIIQFQEDAKAKNIYGLIAVDKKSFLDQNYSKIMFDLRELMGKVDNVIAISGNTRTSSIKLKEYLAEKNELYSLISVQNTLDPERLSDVDFQESVKKLDAKLNELLSSIESDDFQEALILIKSKLSNITGTDDYREYKDVVNDFDLLLVKYPDNATIVEAKEKALETIESAFANKVGSIDFIEALNAIKVLSQIDQSFIIKFDQQKSLLVKSAFELYTDKASRSLASKDYTNAKYLLKKIEDYKYYNSVKYDAILSQIDDNIYKQKLNDIDLLVSNKNYVEAFRVIIETKKEFILKNLSALNQIEELVVNLLTNQKVKEIKNKRPYTWQLQLGAGFISNFYNLQQNTNIADYQVQTASTIYEFGIYKKVNIVENFNTNGKDRSRANAVGLKISVWVPNQSYSFANASSTPLQGGLYFKSNIIEPQLSFFTLKMFNLNFGKIIGDVIDKDANTVLNTKLDFYTLTFGLRPRIGNLMLNLNAKLISDMSSKSYVTANASVVLGLNFARRFKNSEYDQVRNVVLGMKNL
jgi:hypothetical protein